MEIGVKSNLRALKSGSLSALAQVNRLVVHTDEETKTGPEGINTEEHSVFTLQDMLADWPVSSFTFQNKSCGIITFKPSGRL